MTESQKSITNKIYDFLTSRIVMHSIFWSVFFSLLLYVEWQGNQNIPFILTNELINVCFYAAIIYFNLYYLIPNYFRWDKLLHYLGLLTLSVVIVTPIRIMVFYFKFHSYPEIQTELIANQYNIFLIHLLVAGFSTIFKIVSDWARHQREKHELEARTKESELNFLRSQINPHFLFNTLNNLYALTLKKSDKAPEIVIKLSEMMRYM
ncbi:MAG: histidine kinase, partial [Saprospiraceae bacterium]